MRFGGFAGAGLHIHLMQMTGWLMIALFVWLFHGPWLSFKRAVDSEDWPSAGAGLSRIRQIIAVNLPLGLLVVGSSFAGPMLIARSGTTIPMLPLVMAGILSRSPAPGAEPIGRWCGSITGRLRVTHAPPRCFRPAYARRIFVSVEEYGGPDSFDKIHSACKSWCLRKPTPCIAGRNSSRNWLIRSHLYSDTMSLPPALRLPS